MAEMDQDQQLEILPIGERLRRAREAKGIALDDVAALTRIPIRHLLHIEQGEWDALPATTYSVGFARSYANAVGLNGAQIGAELREQLGSGPKPTVPPEYYEPADPARVPPRWLAIIAAVIAIALIVGYAVWRSGIGEGGTPADQGAAGVEVPLPEAQPEAPAPAAAGPQLGQDRTVTLTALGQVWLRVSEEGGRTIAERTLAPGESLQVPADAQRPVLRVGAPEALRVTVGPAEIPQLGPAGRPVGSVSLRPEDLIARARQPGQAQPQAAPGAAPAQ